MMNTFLCLSGTAEPGGLGGPRINNEIFPAFSILTVSNFGEFSVLECLLAFQ